MVHAEDVLGKYMLKEETLCEQLVVGEHVGEPKGQEFKERSAAAAAALKVFCIEVEHLRQMV